MFEKVPGLQFMHVVVDDAPDVTEKVPTLQLMQEVAAVIDDHVPALQLTQDD